jgi:hypothetical protein
MPLKRTKVVTLYLYEDEMAVLEQLAAKKRTSKAAILRDGLVLYERKVRSDEHKARLRALEVVG